MLEACHFVSSANLAAGWARRGFAVVGGEVA